MPGSVGVAVGCTVRDNIRSRCDSLHGAGCMLVAKRTCSVVGATVGQPLGTVGMNVGDRVGYAVLGEGVVQNVGAGVGAIVGAREAGGTVSPGLDGAAEGGTTVHSGRLPGIEPILGTGEPTSSKL